MFEFGQTITFEDGEQEKRRQDLVNFERARTRFLFINEHHGLRCGRFHLLFGTTSSGKSTITRALIEDMAANHKTLLYSTEETYEQMKDVYSVHGSDPKVLEKLFFVHEQTFRRDVKFCADSTNWMARLELELENTQAQVLFLDNLTTSLFYDPLPPSKKADFLSSLKDIAQRRSIPMFLVAHTKRSIKDESFIQATDVRGGDFLVNTSEHVYAVHRFVSKKGSQSPAQHQVIRVLKGRVMANLGKNYCIKFDFNKASAMGDTALGFADLKEIYDDRARF